MILDNIIILLNVLEQFAIRVTIFGMDVEDIIKYVNKLYFSDDDVIKTILSDYSIKQREINPESLIDKVLLETDNEILNNNNFRGSWEYNKLVFVGREDKKYNIFSITFSL